MWTIVHTWYISTILSKPSQGVSRADYRLYRQQAIYSTIFALTLLGLQSRFGDNWGQTTWNLTGLSPKRDWGSKRVNYRLFRVDAYIRLTGESSRNKMSRGVRAGYSSGISATLSKLG